MEKDWPIVSSIEGLEKTKKHLEEEGCPKCSGTKYSIEGTRDVSFIKKDPLITIGVRWSPTFWKFQCKKCGFEKGLGSSGKPGMEIYDEYKGEEVG